MKKVLRRFGAPGTAVRAAFPAEPTASELLVGYGFRGWNAGCETGNYECWQRVWSLYSNVLGTQGARFAVNHLSAWVASLRRCSHRPIEINEMESCEFCRDECLAISMIAASQHKTCPALRACAFAILESCELEEALFHTEAFAIAMSAQGRRLSPGWIANANAYCQAGENDRLH